MKRLYLIYFIIVLQFAVLIGLGAAIFDMKSEGELQRESASHIVSKLEAMSDQLAAFSLPAASTIAAGTCEPSSDVRVGL